MAWVVIVRAATDAGGAAGDVMVDGVAVDVGCDCAVGVEDVTAMFVAPTAGALWVMLGVEAL